MARAALTQEVASLRLSSEGLADSSGAMVRLSREVADVWEDGRELHTGVARLRMLWKLRNCSTVGLEVSSAAELNSAYMLHQETMHYH